VLLISFSQFSASFGATVCDLSLGLSDHKSDFWRALRHPVMINLGEEKQILCAEHERVIKAFFSESEAIQFQNTDKVICKLSYQYY